MEKCFGRPGDASGRLEREIRCYDFLDGLGVSYSRCDHEAAFTMEACEEADKTLGVNMCKNLFLTNRQHTDYYLLLMPGNKVFKTKELSHQIGSARLSFASGEEMEEKLGVTPGSSTVLGLLNDSGNEVRLLIDRDLTKEECFGCHPCINTSSIAFSSKDLFEKVIPALEHEITFVDLKGE
ncbi:MAG: prolyl-tRNA synthetase associated domain-containing protein [Clostridiales bacterium]|nr:prolyl-tRNA synthetase associated domain-containing protein [Clostridiales bacterium]